MKIVVLDGFAVNPGDLDWSFLTAFGEVQVYDKTPDDACIATCKGATAVFTNRCKITEELLLACPTVQYVSALGTGYDMIDTEACRRHGVAVVNIPAYSTASVAQHTVRLLLELYSDLFGMQKIVRDGMWTGIPGYRYDQVLFRELDGQTLGLVGCGSIGKRVAAIASSLGMRVLAYTLHTHADTEQIRYVPLDALLSKSDVVSLHCPLTDSTRKMVDASFLSRMKPGAKLINTARGAILDEAAVAEALANGTLSGAALDVLAEEPARADNPLLTAKNCIITPHIAWATREARTRLLDVIERSLRSFVADGTGLHRIV